MHHNSRRGFLALLGLGAVAPAAAKVADLLPVVEAVPVDVGRAAFIAGYEADPIVSSKILRGALTVKQWDEMFVREYMRESVFADESD